MNQSIDQIGLSRVEPRYIMIDEDIFMSLSPNERSVYETLRYQSDFTKDSSEVKRSIQFIVEVSKVSRTHVFEALNKLEEIGVLKRINRNQFNGVNSYLVSRRLGFFTKSDPIQNTDGGIKNDTNCSEVYTPIQNTDYPVQNTDTNHYSFPLLKTKTLVDSSNTTHMEIPFSPKKKKPKKDYKQDPRFMQFYNVYPKKENPNDAYKAFNALSPDDELLEKIVADVILRTAEHSQWKDKKYIPQPAAYLRKATFDGEIFNEEADKKKKVELQKLENEKKLAAQERFAAKQREYEIQKHDQYNQNSLAFRKFGGEIKRGATISPTAHQHLDNMLKGLRP